MTVNIRDVLIRADGKPIALSAEEQIALVERNPDFIRLILDPKDSIIDYVLSVDGHTIQHITDQTPKRQLVAVKQRPTSIFFIKLPCKEAQAIAAENKLDITYLGDLLDEEVLTYINLTKS